MRITLTLIALALVAALSAALLAPLFIDWSLHRTQIEAELSDALGARVVVSGPIAVGFLPVTYVELSDVKIADSAGGEPVLTCRNLRLEAALGSLPSGRLRFTLARLDHPVLTLARADDGSLDFPNWKIRAQPDRVALDRVVATGGELRVVGGVAPLDAPGLDVDATADSLLGPYKGSVEVASAGVRTELRFAAGPLQKSALPLKLEVVATAGFPNGVFDGTVSLTPRGPGVALAYSGSAAISGLVAATGSEPASPWSVFGSLRADLAGATLSALVARFGPEERALEARGVAQLRMGSTPSLSANLQAKQLNIDALLRKHGEESVAPARAVAALERMMSPLAAHDGSPLGLQLAFSTPTVIVGAQTLSNLAFDAKASPGSSIEGDVAAELPGQSSLSLNGTLELGSAAQFKGRLAATLGDLGQLRDWAAQDEPALARRLALLDDALSYRKASANGDVEISAVGFSARNLQLVVDRTALNGAMAFTRTLETERGRLFMDLRSDVLDVDALPNVSASSALLGDVDLSLALDAAKLRVARVGGVAVGSGSLSLRLTKTGDDISLDRLSIADLGGAAVEARGASGTQGRWLSVQLKADRLREFAALVGRVAPGRVSALLIQRADALSPAKATFEARASGIETDGALFDSVRADGSAGQTRFILKAARAPGGVAASFTLDAADGAALLQQIGLKPVATSAGPARIDASATGRWDAGFDADAEASIAGANVTWRGRLKPDAFTGDDTPLFGATTVKSDNVTGLFAALGLAGSAAASTVPVDLTGDLVLRGGEVHFPHVAGTIAGAKVSGQLSWRPPVEATPLSAAEADVALARSIAGEAPISSATQIEGELALDRASLGGFMSLSLGAPQAAKPGAKWSDAPFAPPIVVPPALDVRLKIDSLEVADGILAHGATTRLKMNRDRLDFDDLAMDVEGGQASGQVTVRRDGAVATLAGQISLDLPSVNRAALRGGLGVTLAFAGTGQSPSALATGLVGEGKGRMSGLVIPRLDPSALSRVLAGAQMPDARIDETNVVHALGLEFDKQAMTVPDATAPVVMNGGAVHVGPIRFAGKGVVASTSADLDLRSLDLTVRTVFATPDGGKFWTGPLPSVAVSVSGPVDAPVRQIDASTFVAGLAAQAIARESDRIAGQEADIRERAAFNRRLKAEQFLRRREAELDAFAQDQARLKSEQDRKRVEDELLRASEAQRQQNIAPAPPAPPPKDSAGPATLGAPAPGTTVRSETTDPTASGLY